MTAVVFTDTFWYEEKCGRIVETATDQDNPAKPLNYAAGLERVKAGEELA